MAKTNIAKSQKRSPVTLMMTFWRRLALAADRAFGQLRSAWPLIVNKLWLSGASSTLLAVFVLGAAFVWPGDIKYSLANQQNCIYNPVFLPRLVNNLDHELYQLKLEGQKHVLGYPLFADRTCAYLKQPVIDGREQQVELIHSFLPFAPKKMNVTAPEPVVIELGRPEEMPVSTSGPLVFRLSQSDLTFGYRLNANGRSVACSHHDSALLCNLDRLRLKQDGQYVFRLERFLNGQAAGTAYEKELKTVEPIRIIKSTVAAGQTVQNIPKRLTLNTNKPIEAYTELKLYLLEGDDKSPVEVTAAAEGRLLSVVLAKPLKRRAQFELRLKGLTAQDGGYLLKPFALRFKTSGGPRVTGTNIGGYGVGTGQAIVLSLDSTPQAGQDLKRFFSISGGLDYSLSGSGKQVVFTPNGSWPRCSRFSITLKDGLKNQYGVGGGSGWQLNSRTLCQQISTIGSSVDGRGIYAYRFGNGSGRVIFVGGTHGDEGSSVYTLNSWIDQLEANYDSIPDNRTVVVIPNINPDGLAAGRRTNANDVDLNRNFPANNWKKDVIMPGGQLNKGGGGSAPLSEPESAAVASYVLNQGPRLVLTYHAIGSLAIANESGNSRSLATTYGQHTGYWSMGNSEIGGIFSHDTTGAFEDWLHDKHGIPALLIELSSYGGNEFWHHQSAMWAMVKA